MNQQIFNIVILASVVSWGAVQAIKPTLKKYSPESWRRVAVRLSAIALGACIGLSMLFDGTGAAAGASGAALSAVIVAAIKRKLSK